MEESEGVAELKKAYAEVILNVSREAASRVMDAERRASSFRRDLCCSREEAVRMLLRLKRMLDSRTLEAETTTAKNEEQIAVLEAQLEEAESKILDLRMELENVRDELKMENTKNNVLCSEENESSSNSDLPENHFVSFEPIVPYSSDSECENAETLDTKERLATGVGAVQRSCNGIRPMGQLADLCLEGSDDQKTGFSAIIMGIKEPEQYRNGCTQRVRAFEGHLLQGTLGCCELDCGSHDKGENKILPVSPSQNSEIGKMLPLPKSERPAVTRKQQRKTTLSKRSKSTQVPIYANQWGRQHVVSSLPLAKSHSTNDCSEFEKDFLTNQITDGDNDVQDSTVNIRKRLQSGDNCTIDGKAAKSKGRRKNKGRKNLINKFQFLSDRHCQGKSVELNTTSKELNEEGVIKAEKSEGLRDCNLVVKKRDLVDDYFISVKCKHDDAKNNMLVPYEESEPGSNSLNSEVNVGRNVQEDGGSVRIDDSGLVKYTFQRKRKTAPSSDVGKNEAGGRNTVKKQADKQSVKVRPEPKGCKLIDGASRDSRRLAQVARQLIALSSRRR